MREKRECTGRECVQGDASLRVRRGGRRRGSRVDARFGTRVQIITREERGRERGFRVALTREEHKCGHELRVVLTREGHRHGHGLRVASIQEREGRVIQMSRTRRFTLRNCLDAGVRSASTIYIRERERRTEVWDKRDAERERGRRRE